MKFACESCRAQYMISDEKVGPRGVKVRCKKCSHVNVVKRQAPAVDPDVVVAPPPAAPPSGNLEDEIGAAFDHMVDGTAPAPAPAAPPAEAPAGFPAGDDFGFDAPSEIERTRIVEMPEMQRVFEEKERAPAAEVPAPAAPAAAAEWYVAIDEEQVGPLTIDGVRSRWDAGAIGPDTLCWRTGMADWTALAQIPELADCLAPRPAPAAEAGGNWLESAMKPQEQPAAAPAWKPTAASALASLVEQEMAASREAPVPEATLERDIPQGLESTGIRSLLRDLPTAAAPAPEQSRLLPLGSSATPASVPVPAPIIAPQHREEPSAAAAAPAAATQAGAPASAAAAPAKKGGAGKWIAAAAVLAIVAGGAFFARDLVAPAAAPVAAAPAPAPAPAAVPAPAPAPEAAVAAAVPAAPADGTGAPPAPAADAAAGAPAAAEAAAEAAGAVAAGGEAAPGTMAATTVGLQEAPAEAAVEAEPAKPEPTPAKVVRPQRKRQAVAAAKRRPEPAPAPASGGGDLLDAAGSNSSIDALFAREFTKKPKAQPKSSGGTYIPPAPGSGGKPHSLSQGDIAGVVVGHKGALKTCVTNYKSKNGGSAGTVVMRWTIQQNGRTSGVKPVKGAEHKELASCIGGLVKGWKFPAYSGPQMAPIDFPFQF